jgi:phosphoglycolate phosphatase-like HAD superfamily hydrolase
MTRLVLFDIDGTLIRTGGAGVQAFAQVFDRHFGARDGFEKLKFAGRTDYGIVREFFEAHKIPATRENFEMFFKEYVVVLEDLLREADVIVCPGVRDFISRTRALQRPPVVGLLTGNVKAGAEIKLRTVSLWDEFAMGGFADDHEDRNCIAAAARQRGEELIGEKLRDTEVLVIGDTPLDIRCGRSIGARVLAVGTGGAKIEELQQHAPEYLASTLAEFDERWLSEG